MTITHIRAEAGPNKKKTLPAASVPALTRLKHQINEANPAALG